MKHTSYGRALGESTSIMSNMAGMAMSVKEPSSPPFMSIGADMNISNNNSKDMSSSITMSTNSMKKVTEYHTAQALAELPKMYSIRI
ncbi:MAG TPA: hypothetical protein VJ729_00715 [Nitrososphaeraceae archaeon]|nr:hypothetical protein [Nitrososphaeraceae archaeon]